jgi:uncharacterized protein YtpQ (UPF0354 family)
MPMSVDTDRLAADLPKVMEMSLEKTMAQNPRPDTTLRHAAMVADVTKEGQGGHYWVVAAGDVVLFASSEVPIAERDVWNPTFQELMASLQVTRDDHLIMRKLANEVLEKLRQRHPEQEFAFDGDKIRGKGQVVYLSNLYREVRSAPNRRDEIIKRFVNILGQPMPAEMGQEVWEETRGSILPVLKSRDYIRTEGPTQHLLTTEWLADVLICYVIQRRKMLRFVTGWDVNRWELTPDLLHQEAIANLTRLPWPREMMGSRGKDDGRVIVVDTDDNLASSRLLHPDLFKLFSGPLGNPFWAGIPCRERLVVYSDRRLLKQRIGRRLRKDHDASAYPITPRPFLVTRDGIAASPAK